MPNLYSMVNQLWKQADALTIAITTEAALLDCARAKLVGRVTPVTLRLVLAIAMEGAFACLGAVLAMPNSTARPASPNDAQKTVQVKASVMMVSVSVMLDLVVKDATRDRRTSQHASRLLPRS